MSKKAEFTVTGSPADVAEKALEVIRNNVPSGTHLSNFRVWEGQDRLQAIGESTTGIFHNSAVWVEAKRGNGGTTVEVHANDDKSTSLVNELKKRL